ncbi:DNA cytosine methyltransferase [Coleofasciculus sp.]|uniref:DNA cytosine methyltransferase n=1 Tax=Coleofasciculus sp. TaxID=3100458 RepID=UPI0039FB3100
MKSALSSNQLELFNPSKPSNLLWFNPRFTFVDLFSGIGGFRIALEELGGKCLGYSEIDKEAVKTYKKNFISYLNSEEVNLGDIVKLGKLPFSVDIVVGGVPCQPWSIAGKIKGLDDPRGKLWFDVIRVVAQNQPKGFIFENVKGLTDPRHRQSFELIISKLKSLGYNVKASVINSYDFGVPQDRERVFIVGVRDDLDNSESFQFPEPLHVKPKLYEFIEGIEASEVRKKKFSPDILFGGKIPASRGRFQKNDELNDFFIFTDIRDGHTTIHSWDLVRTTQREKLICQTILKNRRKKKYGLKDGNPLSFEVLDQLIPNLTAAELDKLITKKILRYIDHKGYEFFNSKISSGINGISKIFLPNSDVIGTLTATGTRDFVATVPLDSQEPQDYKNTFIREIYRKGKYKPLSAKDYARLQGFPDWFTIADKESTAKKQFGNAVSVPVVYHIAKALVKVIL